MTGGIGKSPNTRAYDFSHTFAAQRPFCTQLSHDLISVSFISRRTVRTVTDP